MTDDEREIRRKLRVIKRAEEIGSAAKAYRYFGVPRTTFFRWLKRYRELGEQGLINKKPIVGTHPNRTPDEIVQKVLYLRKKYHLGPMRIMWYMARYHDLKMSDATIYRVLKRHGVSRLPGNIGRRKVHTKRYQKQVPGHHIQMDVKFLIFKGKDGKKIKRYQYTAIDDATRVRALKVYKRHTQKSAIGFVNHIIENSLSEYSKSGLIAGMSSRHSSTGTLKTSVFGTSISKRERPSSMVRSSGHIDPISRSFTS